jgi:hypothetical protein
LENPFARRIVALNAAWRRIQWAGAGALGWMSMKSGMTAL